MGGNSASLCWSKYHASPATQAEADDFGTKERWLVHVAAYALRQRVCMVLVTDDLVKHSFDTCEKNMYGINPLRRTVWMPHRTTRWTRMAVAALLLAGASALASSHPAPTLFQLGHVA